MRPARWAGTNKATSRKLARRTERKSGTNLSKKTNKHLRRKPESRRATNLSNDEPCQPQRKEAFHERDEGGNRRSNSDLTIGWADTNH